MRAPVACSTRIVDMVKMTFSAEAEINTAAAEAEVVEDMAAEVADTKVEVFRFFTLIIFALESRKRTCYV